jgi:hypothetical protein
MSSQSAIRNKLIEADLWDAHDPRDPAHDIAAALDLAEFVCAEINGDFRLDYCAPDEVAVDDSAGAYSCWFEHDGKTRSFAQGATSIRALIICIAALKALGIDVDE